MRSTDKLAQAQTKSKGIHAHYHVCTLHVHVRHQEPAKDVLGHRRLPSAPEGRQQHGLHCGKARLCCSPPQSSGGSVQADPGPAESLTPSLSCLAKRRPALTAHGLASPPPGQTH